LHYWDTRNAHLWVLDILMNLMVWPSWLLI
jgi:hypothetical protein